MIHVYLSMRALAAARDADPTVNLAAVHAAVEVTVAEALRSVAGMSREEIQARAEAIEHHTEGPLAA